MIKLNTNTATFYLHDDGTVCDAHESNALFGEIYSNVLFDTLEAFLVNNIVTSIISEDGYKFVVTNDIVFNDDMSFDSLQSAVEALQS